MKTALVTGSAGFIGRHMVRELISRGYRVDGVDPSYPVGPESDDIGPAGEDIIAYDAHSLFGEECQLDCHQTRYDLVVHCAYHVGGRAAIDGVNTNFAKNLQLDAAMFEWAVRTKQRRVLYFSSSAAYPKYLQRKGGFWDDFDIHHHPKALREDAIDLSVAVEPDANYGWAKLTGERLAEDACRNGLPVTVVRPFSGYAESQSLDYPFPSIVQRARQGDLTVWGPPGQTRDWIHVDDVVAGALAVAESETADPVNLCTGVATEMGELARMIETQHLFGLSQKDFTNVGKVTYLEDKPTGVFYRVGDPQRLHKYYVPTISLEEGVAKALQALR